MKGSVRIVCARADAPRVLPGTQFGLKCAECGRGVMLAPAAQTMLAENPDAEVVCNGCGQEEETGMTRR